jgi:hypothetical protein
VQRAPQARLTPSGVLQLPAPGGSEAITAAVRGVLQALA